MKKTIRILRRESYRSEPYWEDYLFENVNEASTIASVLMSLEEKDRVQTESMRPFRPIAWECSCLQKKCGACAMVIGGKPALACDTKLSECSGETVTVEPLRKFKVIEDLRVDRSEMMERLKTLSVWFEDDAKTTGEKTAFEASRCLQCGLCLEVCPNFYSEGKFGGMAAMAPLSRLIAKLPDGQRKSVSKNYEKAVYNGCGKSLACRDICPAEIDLEKLLVKSNAAAVWRRWKNT